MREYALQPSQSLGRKFPEPSHPYRNDYQRDRDRIIHSRAFRRLEDKTQVFTIRFSDHFRNRLTHTIEVAQISRTIAGVMGLNGELAEALALAHDIGHPPFGHCGEKCLDQIMQTFGDRFDHNLHALRIVESFEQRYAEFPGLNLTFEVREGIVKHSRDYSPLEYPELAEYLLDQRPPLEAQLIDLADEIAYCTADLDDGFEAKLLSIDQMCQQLPVFEQFHRQVERQFPSALLKLQFNETLKRLLNHLVTDLMESSLVRLAENGITTVAQVRNHPRRLIGFSPEVEGQKTLLREFLNRNLYLHAAFQPEREQGSQLVQELFQYYLDHPEKLPPSYAGQAQQAPPQRVICGYIAGMTDGYIQKLHQELLGGTPLENRPGLQRTTSTP
ncbi:MAG: deoxyguanosinetriphosphate triphosphohydrolase [Acidobacteria bacterium RIFCSPLOWO2_02_FULL_59_13]|nr:MAG: deoxyguanosinetriphosphate triphosphohydrolase [Acidobacteria bacterium RIFCSPLOWO2_02_FULL_59_13]